ncbi:MAG TPA: c-type cytochrome [Actinomycetota bacterium]|nr:c-type cytochrome [Actinomycetota bacterium]
MIGTRSWRRLPAVIAVALVPTAAIQLLGLPVTAQQTDHRLARGADLYAAGCASCHGPGGEGGVGPSLIGVGAAGVDFMLSTGRMPLADPDQTGTRGEPAYSAEEIDAIVAFVTSLGSGGPPIPSVDPARGAVATGREVFTANCLACHGAGAQGASVGGGQVAPPLDQATALQIAEAVRFGPGPMPRFGDEQVTQHELDSLVRYVVSLRDATDPGGLGLGHVGPVVEGLIAWLVGLGLLVLAIRFAGTRT